MNREKSPIGSVQKRFDDKLQSQSDFVKEVYKIIDYEIKDDYGAISEKEEKLNAAVKASEYAFTKLLTGLTYKEFQLLAGNRPVSKTTCTEISNLISTAISATEFEHCKSCNEKVVRGSLNCFGKCIACDDIN